MKLDHVFAKSTQVVQMPGGYPVTVPGGSHWLADDAVVQHRPDLFTEDCRYGLLWSGEPPAVLSIPPGQEDPEMTAKVRSRSQAERAMDERAALGDEMPLTRGRRRSAPAAT